VFGGSKSRTVYIFCSVLQGSVLGPLLFIVYTADLADIVDQHGVFLHAFADDTQMYLHCHSDDLQSAAASVKPVNSNCNCNLKVCDNCNFNSN